MKKNTKFKIYSLFSECGGMDLGMVDDFCFQENVRLLTNRNSFVNHKAG